MTGKLIISGSSVNNETLSDEPAIVAGWVSGPNSRGTMDIIWDSFLTIFLCTWLAVCLNIPRPGESSFQILRRKAKWMFWAIIGPELVLSIAIGQYASARRSVRRFDGLGYPQWTLRHAFFADMGGIILQPKDSTSFPTNGRQLAYLVQKKYVDFPNITDEEIWDKSKADVLSKVLTLTQACWLLLHLLGRAVLRLATSPLELSACAIVFCTFGTFFCWLHKPSDVNRGIVICTNASTKEILLEGGDAAATPYQHTPLDFVAKQSFTVGYDVMGFFNFRCDDRERPLRRFPNDRFPDISTLEKLGLFVMTTAYAALHLIGWRCVFPTKVESIMWRTSSLIVTGATVFFWIFETIAARQRFGRWDKYLNKLHLKKRPSLLNDEVIQVDGQPTTQNPDIVEVEQAQTVGRQDTLKRLDAFEVEQRNAKPVLAWEALLLLPIVVLYAVARGYMIVEALISLRELPLETFKTFDVAQVIPHW